MGCGSSRHTLDQVDDSVHVMLKHDKKVALKKGKDVNAGYKPRAEHPLLMKPKLATRGEEDTGGGTAAAAAVVAVEEEDEKNNNSNGSEAPAAASSTAM
jgi:hypothetical protein